MASLPLEILVRRLADPLRKPRPLPAEGLARAAVLVPLLAAGAEPRLLFTRRTDTVETHKGQISFPGGVEDPGDGTPEATALREAEEEVGIVPGDVATLGRLDDFRTPTGFLVTPVVGLLSREPALRPNRDEVAEVFTVPLAFFLDPGNGWTERRTAQGRAYDVWFYRHGDNVIWGVTGGIIRSLVSALSP